jgi:phosphohistidine phosphatase SixA
MRGLQPTDPPGLTKDLVAGESRDVMLVGHMPNLSRTAALLTTGSGDTAFDFPSHGIVAIEFEGERWVERWRLE